MYPLKQQKSIELLNNSPETFISTQVINEFSNAFIKKFKAHTLDVLKALEEIENSFIIYQNNIHTTRLACNLYKRYKFSFYDSLIIAAAIESGCKVLYSEDMNNHQIIDSLIIINPLL